MSEKQDELQPIIVKKVKKVAGGHHGGAWKVAYADFVTAMMAFFLLLWLLNVTTEEQKLGIADYFDPNPRISRGKDGAGGMLGGQSISTEGQMVTDKKPILQAEQKNRPTLKAGSERPQKETAKPTPSAIKQGQRMGALRAAKIKAEEKNLKKTADAVQAAIQKNPELKKMSDQLKVDMTAEGLRIQILDEDGKPMFPSGSAKMFAKMRKLIAEVTKVVMAQPNEISIRGHTDGVPYGAGATYTNWELSAERANSTRRVMLESGLDEKRINNVLGKADKDHLFPDNPRDARNRRISIILLREELTLEEGANKSSDAVTKKKEEIKSLYQRSSGKVDFP